MLYFGGRNVRALLLIDIKCETKLNIERSRTLNRKEKIGVNINRKNEEKLKFV